MSDLDHDVLVCLRIFGPCSKAEVAQRLDQHPSYINAAIYRLSMQRFLICQDDQWDVSQQGRDYFDWRYGSVSAPMKG